MRINPKHGGFCGDSNDSGGFCGDSNDGGGFCGDSNDGGGFDGGGFHGGSGWDGADGTACNKDLLIDKKGNAGARKDPKKVDPKTFV